ncbi:MAG: hypothetical protein D6737_05130 [Chloroflexi bacterium]|nr:MAG: hypothetical protein CUN54_01955 [Phototrophicales bacterium]RMF81372.1 MAG: hypothetical protein D6737_05130 [Chloroflexota bacterium]
MSEQPLQSSDSSEDPKWLIEFESLANEQLGHGSSCEQIHPIIERWYNNLLEDEPPATRDSVWQAMACLATELLLDAPEEITDVLIDADDDVVALWIEHILLVGRALEIGLQKGDLDDL